MPNRQVLVAFGDRRKVIALQECPDKSTDLLLLTNEFKRVFEVNTLGSIIFQKFEEDWNEYIDVEEGTELANKDKLKAIVLATGESSITASSSAVDEQQVGKSGHSNTLPVIDSHQSFTEKDVNVQSTSSSTSDMLSANNEVTYIII